MLGIGVNLRAARCAQQHRRGTLRVQSTGDGSGVATMRMRVSEDMTLTITSGTARFYTDAAGTVDRSTTWTIKAGALRTIYLRAPSGESVIEVPDRYNVISIGEVGVGFGWVSGAYSSYNNAPILRINIAQFVNAVQMCLQYNTILTGAPPTGLTILYLSGNTLSWTYNGALPSGVTQWLLDGSNIYWTYTGAPPSGITFWHLAGNNIYWTYTGAPPSGVTFWHLSGNNIYWTYTGAPPSGITRWLLAGSNIYWNYTGAPPSGVTIWYLSGNNIDWTGLSAAGSANITLYNVVNHRIIKMTDEELITLLTSLTNRVGGLPTTITIGDYQNWNNPPQSVIDAVDLLKSTKNVTTVTLSS